MEIYVQPDAAAGELHCGKIYTEPGVATRKFVRSIKLQLCAD
jgi:hypothetical protein